MYDVIASRGGVSDPGYAETRQQSSITNHFSLGIRDAGAVLGVLLVVG
jgi:hypothetical protein